MKTYSLFSSLVLLGIVCLLAATPAQAARRGTVPVSAGNGTKLVVSPK